MTKLRHWLWDQYAALLKDASVRLRAEHYQRRYDGNRVGAALTMFRMAATGGRRLQEDDIFACYPTCKYFDRQGFEEELCGYDVISFDVFDTLLLRQVNRPKDVFSILEKEHHLPGFARDRELSEHLARETKFTAEGTYEVTIDDIYRMPAMRAYGTQDELTEMELEEEKHCCYANPAMLELFERLCLAGKSVVVTSDMYLHTEFIRELLDNCGYRGIDAYFISGDYGAGKGSGGLFSAVQEYAGGHRAVHIGDNFFGDVYPLKGSDIMPFHYLAGRKEKKGEER